MLTEFYLCSKVFYHPWVFWIDYKYDLFISLAVITLLLQVSDYKNADYSSYITLNSLPWICPYETSCILSLSLVKQYLP